MLLLGVEGNSIALTLTTFLGAKSWLVSWCSFTEALFGIVWVWIVSNHWSDALLGSIISEPLTGKLEARGLVPVNGLVDGCLVVWLELLLDGSAHVDGSLASASLTIVSALLGSW